MPITKSSTSTDSLQRLYLEGLVADGNHRALLNELLAIIHRDGGQYTELAGLAVSVEDAITKVVDTHYRLRELQRENAKR